MSGRIRVRVNTKRARERFEALPPAVRGRTSQELQEGAIRIRDRARQNAPRRSGRLARSIIAADTPGQIRAAKDAAAAGRGTDLQLTEGRTSYVTGTALFYARWVHDGRQSGPRLRSNPFLLRAFEGEKGDIYVRLRRGIREAARSA